MSLISITALEIGFASAQIEFQLKIGFLFLLQRMRCDGYNVELLYSNNVLTKSFYCDDKPVCRGL